MELITKLCIFFMGVLVGIVVIGSLTQDIRDNLEKQVESLQKDSIMTHQQLASWQNNWEEYLTADSLVAKMKAALKNNHKLSVDYSVTTKPGVFFGFIFERVRVHWLTREDTGLVSDFERMKEIYSHDNPLIGKYNPSWSRINPFQ